MTERQTDHKPEPPQRHTSIRSELPYHGVLPFPDCTINDTDPTRLDRILFNRLLEQSKPHNSDSEDESALATPQPFNYVRLQIKRIQFRDYEIDTWYTAPYPEEYLQAKVLYICEHCLKYMLSSVSYQRHTYKNCSDRHPPGVEIYRDEASRIALWEVDGRKNISYCQNLCLLAKLFLNSKTLYYDVEPFIFYVLTEMDENDPFNYHFVGYFSKEKLNSSDYNVSCILTLPIYQRKGYGNLLIDFSYLLTRHEFKFGTPEKPLSDLGLLSYRNYWKVAIAYQLKALHDKYLSSGSRLVVSVEILSKLTGMIPSDVIVGLEQLDLLVKHPLTGQYAIVINLARVDLVINKWEAKKYLKLNPANLLWKPMLFGPSGGINSAPAVPTSTQLANPISHIANFLKDDLNNPYSFEEEAHKEIEAHVEMLDDDEPPHVVTEFVVCHPFTVVEERVRRRPPMVVDDDEVPVNEGPVTEGPVTDEEKPTLSDDGFEDASTHFDDIPLSPPEIPETRRLPPDITPRRSLRSNPSMETPAPRRSLRLH